MPDRLISVPVDRSMVGLLDIDPDFGRVLSLEDRVIAQRFGLPVHEMPAGPTGADVNELLAEEQALGAIVLDGMLVHRLQVADQIGLRLLGAGDIVIRATDARLTVLADSTMTGTPTSRLAVLDDALLLALRRWPRLAVRLLERLEKQSQMLAAQFVIAELPRVDQRVMALLWLLAERWGYVSTIGTHLRLNLTHETLGALVGARRPTITLAVSELLDRGALIKQQQGWLLIEPPPQPTGTMADTDTPTIEIHGGSSAWSGVPEPPAHSPHSTFRAQQQSALQLSESARASAHEQTRRAAMLCHQSRELERRLAITARRHS
jgi:CRP/FNR family transcriptional regulator, cyclic AMP receptor protein